MERGTCVERGAGGEGGVSGCDWWSVLPSCIGFATRHCFHCGSCNPIPSPLPPPLQIFVRFENADQARVASLALAGRKFQSRTVVTAFFPEAAFEARTFPD